MICKHDAHGSPIRENVMSYFMLVLSHTAYSMCYETAYYLTDSFMSPCYCLEINIIYMSFSFYSSSN